MRAQNRQGTIPAASQDQLWEQQPTRKDGGRLEKGQTEPAGGTPDSGRVGGMHLPVSAR